MVRIIIAFIFLFIVCQVAEAKFFNLYLYRQGGDAIVSGDIATMAKFDHVITQKATYDDVGGDTYGSLRSANPNIVILVYHQTDVILPSQDATSAVNLTSLGRYDVDRGHSMGDLNTDNAGLFLLDGSSNRIEWTFPTPTGYWLDFGDSNFYDYSIEAMEADIIGQAWEADGILFDHMWSTESGVDVTPPDYNTDELWSAAMNSYTQAMVVALAAEGQLFGANRGLSRTSAGSSAWLALDASASPPYAQMDEVFISGVNGSNQEYVTAAQWLVQIDLIGAIENSNTYMEAATPFSLGGSGTDINGDPATFWQVLWFSMCSYLIGKNEAKNNSYFQLQYGSTSDVNKYYDEYDYIDLGGAVGNYYSKVVDGVTVYLRKFDNGYVIVNPQSYTNDLTNVSFIDDLDISELVREITHSNMNQSWDSINYSTQFATFNAHEGKILYTGTSPHGKGLNIKGVIKQ